MPASCCSAAGAIEAIPGCYQSKLAVHNLMYKKHRKRTNVKEEGSASGCCKLRGDAGAEHSHMHSTAQHSTCLGQPSGADDDPTMRPLLQGAFQAAHAQVLRPLAAVLSSAGRFSDSCLQPGCPTCRPWRCPPQAAAAACSWAATAGCRCLLMQLPPAAGPPPLTPPLPVAAWPPPPAGPPASQRSQTAACAWGQT